MQESPSCVLNGVVAERQILRRGHAVEVQRNLQAEEVLLLPPFKADILRGLDVKLLPGDLGQINATELKLEVNYGAWNVHLFLHPEFRVSRFYHLQGNVDELLRQD